MTKASVFKYIRLSKMPRKIGCFKHLQIAASTFKLTRNPLGMWLDGTLIAASLLLSVSRRRRGARTAHEVPKWGIEEWVLIWYYFRFKMHLRLALPIFLIAWRVKTDK